MEKLSIQKLKEEALALQLNSHNMVWEENDFVILRDMTDLSFAQSTTNLNMAVFGVCQEGECELALDEQVKHVSAGNYLVLLPNTSVRVISSSMRGIFICLSEKMYNELLQRVQTTPMLLYVREYPTAALQEADIQWLTKYHNLIFEEMQQADNLFRSSTAKSLMAALFFKVCNLYGKSMFSSHPMANRQEEIFTEFLKLLSQHFREEHTIGFYADKLCITPKYLSGIVKEVSGESANKWIQSFVVKEAKILLLTTHLNIQQITNLLNFPSQSFFGKYFKQHTGISPLQFRKRNKD